MGRRKKRRKVLGDCMLRPRVTLVKRVEARFIWRACRDDRVLHLAVAGTARRATFLLIMLATKSRRSILSSSQSLRRSAIRNSTTRRCYAKKNAEVQEKTVSGPSQTYVYEKPTPPPETWLARYLKSSPKAMSVFQGITCSLGINNPRQMGGRISYHWYQKACVPRELEEREFWHRGQFPLYHYAAEAQANALECRLPPTFQTWFTVTNLHIWLLTVRFRSLPSPHGENFVQGQFQDRRLVRTGSHAFFRSH